MCLGGQSQTLRAGTTAYSSVYTSAILLWLQQIRHSFFFLFIALQGSQEYWALNLSFLL